MLPQLTTRYLLPHQRSICNLVFHAEIQNERKYKIVGTMQIELSHIEAKWVEIRITKSETKCKIGPTLHGYIQTEIRWVGVFYLCRRRGDRETEIGSDGESIGHASDAPKRLLSNPGGVSPHRHFPRQPNAARPRTARSGEKIENWDGNLLGNHSTEVICYTTRSTGK